MIVPQMCVFTVALLAYNGAPRYLVVGHHVIRGLLRGTAQTAFWNIADQHGSAVKPFVGHPY